MTRCTCLQTGNATRRAPNSVKKQTHNKISFWYYFITEKEAWFSSINTRRNNARPRFTPDFPYSVLRLPPIIAAYIFLPRGGRKCLRKDESVSAIADNCCEWIYGTFCSELYNHTWGAKANISKLPSITCRSARQRELNDRRWTGQLSTGQSSKRGDLLCWSSHCCIPLCRETILHRLTVAVSTLVHLLVHKIRTPPRKEQPRPSCGRLNFGHAITICWFQLSILFASENDPFTWDEHP